MTNEMAFNNPFLGMFNYFSHFSLMSFLLILTVCVLLHYIFSSTCYSPPLPPGPKFWLPLIGHLHLLEPDMRKSFKKYRKQYGDIYTLYLGERLAIIISGYDAIREAFLKNGEVFNGRTSLSVTYRQTRNLGFILATGDLWREHRHFALNTLKIFGMGKSKLEGKIHEEAVSLTSQIENFKGKPFDPSDIVSTNIANIICSLLFKSQFTHDDHRFQGMIRLIDENIASAAGLANFMPWLAEFPGDPLKCKTFISNVDKLYEFIDDIIDEHVTNFNDNEIEDLTSAYIKEMGTKVRNGEKTTMSLAQLSGTVADLFIAGTHITTATIRWAIICLVQYPDVQEKIYINLCSTIGKKRLPTVKDKGSLGYLEAFYLEVLRFCSLSIFGGLRSTTRDFTFMGYTIPKEAIIMPDMDSALNDPWPDPDIFKPERFLDKNGKVKKKEENIPFFFGKRSCIGEALARDELSIFLGAIVQKFRLESPENEIVSVQHLDGVFGLSHSPKPYNIVANPRS